MKLVDKLGRIIINFLIIIIGIVTLFCVYSYVSLEFLGNNYVSVFGYTYFEVASGSMSPVINMSDLIIVKIDADYMEEDIITYFIDGDFITHRVKKINIDTIVTKGDANNTKDALVNKENVLGKVVYVIPYAGVWKKVFMSPKVILLLIITFVLFSFAFSYNSKGKRKKIELKKAKKEKNIEYEIPILKKNDIDKRGE